MTSFERALVITVSSFYGVHRGAVWRVFLRFRLFRSRSPYRHSRGGAHHRGQCCCWFHPLSMRPPRSACRVSLVIKAHPPTARRESGLIPAAAGDRPRRREPSACLFHRALAINSSASTCQDHANLRSPSTTFLQSPLRLLEASRL